MLDNDTINRLYGKLNTEDPYMVESIYEALHKTEKEMASWTPPTKKKVVKTIDITDVKPIDLANFMEENNVPANADFQGVDNGYDGWYPYYLKLEWVETIETDEADHRMDMQKRFENRALKNMKCLLLSRGYKWLRENKPTYKDLRDICVYDVYKEGNLKALTIYYSRLFI